MARPVQSTCRLAESPSTLRKRSAGAAVLAGRDPVILFQIRGIGKMDGRGGRERKKVQSAECKRQSSKRRSAGADREPGAFGVMG